MLNDFGYRLRALFRRATMETELDEELRAHVEHQADKYVRSGLLPEQALRRARLELGGVEQVKEECRDARGVTMIENTVKDLRYGLRMLGKNPVFTAVAVLTLALGIGANTAIFTLLDAVVLRFLPVEKPEELVLIMRHSPRRGGEATSSFTNPIWEQIRDQQYIFSGAFAWGNERFDLARDGEAHYINGLFVSGDFFRTLGVRPAIGRLIDRSDDRRGGSVVAVLSYSFWQDHYGGAESVVGSTIWLRNNSYPIIGVAAPGFNGLDVGSKFEVALPLSATEIVYGNAERLEHRSFWWLNVMARLKPGITPESAKAHLDLLSPRIFSATVPGNWDPEGQKNYQKYTLSTTPASTGTSGLRQLMEEPLDILMAVVGLVLLVACANLAGLMLARSAARNQELALRRALGASRGRLIRQLLTECLLLSSAGALLGILFARWGAMLLVRFVSTGGNPVFLDLSYNWRTLAFTALIAIGTGLLFGVLPAFRATRASLVAGMKGSPSIDTQRHIRLRPGRWVVASQVALSLVVLVVAGLFLRSFVKLVTLDVGFDRTNVLVMRAEARTRGTPQEKQAVTWDEIERRVASVPGVQSVSRTNITPISGSEWNQGLLSDAPNAPTGDSALIWMNSVSPGYFKTMRIALLAGRDFGAQDSATAPQVAIINRTAARRFYPNLNPVGRSFRLLGDDGKPERPIQIVGLASDSKYSSLKEDTYPCAYLPLAQNPGFGGPNFMIRTAVDPAAVLSLVRQSVAEVDGSTALEFNTLESQVNDSLVQERVLTTLSCFFGALVLLLAAIGLYGVISHSVTQRRTEFGVRMALGAARGSIFRLVLVDVVAILVVGVTAGVVVSFLVVQFLEKFLFGLPARDVFTLAIGAATLSLVAGIAGALPARRATKVDPNVALRYE